MKQLKNSDLHHILILPDIRSAHNIGSIFRTADAAGITKIYIVGYTPTPIDKFGRAQGEIAKTALGAEKTISWEYKKTIAPLLKKLKQDGYTLIAIEQSDNSIDYKKVKIGKNKAAFILGNEVDGLSKSVLQKMDIIAEIPMRGKKESLNVGVSFGIAIFRLLSI